MEILKKMGGARPPVGCGYLPGVDFVPFFAIFPLVRYHMGFKWEAIRMTYPAFKSVLHRVTLRSQ